MEITSSLYLSSSSVNSREFCDRTKVSNRMQINSGLKLSASKKNQKMVPSLRRLISVRRLVFLRTYGFVEKKSKNHVFIGWKTSLSPKNSVEGLFGTLYSALECL